MFLQIGYLQMRGRGDPARSRALFDIGDGCRLDAMGVFVRDSLMQSGVLAVSVVAPACGSSCLGGFDFALSAFSQSLSFFVALIIADMLVCYAAVVKFGSDQRQSSLAFCQFINNTNALDFGASDIATVHVGT